MLWNIFVKTILVENTGEESAKKVINLFLIHHALFERVILVLSKTPRFQGENGYEK